MGSDISFWTRSRPPGQNGVSHGGVGIAIKSSISTFKPYPVQNPEDYEVLIVSGHLKRIKRKFFLLSVYIPPNYSVPRGKGALQFVYDQVLDIKLKYPDPYIIVAGDFNQWKIGEALLDFPDLWEAQVGPTRNDRSIDRIISNLPQNESSSNTLPPLQAENSESDHRVARLVSKLECREKEKWTIRSYRQTSKKAEIKFIEAINQQSWQTVFAASGSDNKLAAFQDIIDQEMNKHFPWRKSRRREGDLPWIDNAAKKKIRKKKAVYKDEGKSPRFIKLQENLERYLDLRRENFLAGQRDKLLSGDAEKHFYKNVKEFKSAEKPAQFSVTDILPEKPESEVAEAAASFFNQISNEFSPLRPEHVPTTHHRSLPRLSPEEVAKQLREQKKPGSMVHGDMFPKHINSCATSLSRPLCSIFNEIMETYTWPEKWKVEYVTLIPKKNLPASFADLRNISCTNFFSKVFESFVLRWAMSEVTVKTNQYGGVKGCSTSHMLLEIWNDICSNAEDYRSCTVLTSIDYAKAFNRLSFQKCLDSFAKKGASTSIIRLLATFLSNRMMTVRTGGEWSQLKAVNGGCPQGSILGVYLFNVTTDDLEEDFEAFDKIVVEKANSERQQVQILPNVMNVPSHLTLPETEQAVGTQNLTSKPTKTYKYVDDNITSEKMNLGGTASFTNENGTFKLRRAIPSQNAFRSIVRNAGIKGMQVNSAKTNLLCISDALSYRPMAFIEDENGERIDSCSDMKVLGFTFEDRPVVKLHVQSIVKKFRQRYWVLRHLKKLGFTCNELVRVYKMNILPVADYTDVIYHSLMTDELDELLENAQNSALKCIFDYRLSARALREKAGLSTLRKRRIDHIDKFAKKTAANPRFAHLFPLKHSRAASRSGEIYLEEYARCDRLRNSPLFFMRRRLNGKEGKSYGERNRVFREA